MFLPVFINLENKDCLVVGGGKVAYRKILKLLEHDANITIFSKYILEDILVLYSKNTNKIKIIENDFTIENFNILKEYFLVIVSTDNMNLNSSIASYCINNNILVNNVSSKENMNVKFCATIENENYSIGVSSAEGVLKSVELRDKIKEYLNNL